MNRNTQHLNRYLSLAAGVSRRVADEMVRNGRVTLDGLPVLDPGTLWDPAIQEVRLDGRTLVPIRDEKIYIMLYKPDNVVTTMKDREGRKTAPSLIGELSSRVFPVGRLDASSSGLILMTNDGELANRLTHPRYEHEVEYAVTTDKPISDSHLRRFEEGFELDGTRLAPAKVRRITKNRFFITLRDGKQIRHMCDSLGYTVTGLERVRLIRHRETDELQLHAFLPRSAPLSGTCRTWP